MFLKRVTVLFCCFLWAACFRFAQSQEAKFEGQPSDKIKNSEDAKVVLKIAALADEPDKIAFMVKNIGEKDVLIHALDQVENEVRIRKPDGNILKSDISKRTAYKRFKSGEMKIHTKVALIDFISFYSLKEYGYYEVTWVVEGKWESNTFIVYVPEKKEEPVEEKK